MNERNPDKLFIHKSGLSSWRQCPRKFYWMYVKQQNPEAGDENNIAMEHGATFHHVARQFTYLYDTDVLFESGTFIDRLKYLNTCIPKGISSTIYGWMQNLIDFEARRSLGWTLDRSKFKPFMTERYLESDDLNYAGTFDRLDWYSEDELIVVDYKPRIYNLSSLRQEQAIYWALIMDNFEALKLPAPVNHWGVIAYDEGIYRSEEFKKVTFTALKKNTNNLQDKIEEFKLSKDMSVFPMKPGESCDWCSFLSICWLDPTYVEMVLNAGAEEKSSEESSTT